MSIVVNKMQIDFQFFVMREFRGFQKSAHLNSPTLLLQIVGP